MEVLLMVLPHFRRECVGINKIKEVNSMKLEKVKGAICSLKD